MVAPIVPGPIVIQWSPEAEREAMKEYVDSAVDQITSRVDQHLNMAASASSALGASAVVIKDSCEAVAPESIASPIGQAMNSCANGMNNCANETIPAIRAAVGEVADLTKSAGHIAVDVSVEIADTSFSLLTVAD